LSLHFSQTGQHVIATDLNGAAATETAKIAGTNCRAETLDVASESSRQAFFAALGDTPVDVLVNNAGFQFMAPLEEFPQTKWEQLVDVVLNGTAAMTRAVLPGMRARCHGRIINIGSTAGLIGAPFKSAYVAAKHGLIGFSKTIALETADVDITINTICPVYIKTPLVDGQIKDQARLNKVPEDEVVQRLMLDPMPKKAFITFEEIAAAIEYLVSHNARNITGQTITIDGGLTAR
jgi:3-hydroxybutyrate dehydrogenase